MELFVFFGAILLSEVYIHALLNKGGDRNTAFMALINVIFLVSIWSWVSYGGFWGCAMGYNRLLDQLQFTQWFVIASLCKVWFWRSSRLAYLAIPIWIIQSYFIFQASVHYEIDAARWQYLQCRKENARQSDLDYDPCLSCNTGLIFWYY